MKAIAVTIKGIEEIALEEIREITKAKPKTLTEGRLIFDIKSLKTLEKARTVTKLYKYLKHFTFKKEEDIYKQAKKIKFPIKKDFVVRCHREGSHDFRSKNIEAGIGEIIFKRGNKVNLEKPKTTIYVEIIQNTCITGILHKNDMQKRDYKVRQNPASVNACLAAAMIRFAETKPKHVTVDPFCKDGVILIEAVLQGIKKVHGFDESLNNVKNARINTQMAKTEISIGKAEIDWLDTKFEKESVDRIITSPPFPSKHKNPQEIEKITKEFISQARYILKKDGLLTVIIQDPSILDKHAEANGFRKVKETKVLIGNTVYTLQAFKP